MKTHNQRMNNVIGQLEGIRQMMEEDKDCFLVLTQMKAARSALQSLMTNYMKDHFQICLQKCRTDKNSEDDVCQKFFNEIIQNS